MKVSQTISMSVENVTKIKALAQAKGISFSAWLMELVEKELAKPVEKVKKKK